MNSLVFIRIFLEQKTKRKSCKNFKKGYGSSYRGKPSCHNRVGEGIFPTAARTIGIKLLQGVRGEKKFGETASVTTIINRTNKVLKGNGLRA